MTMTQVNIGTFLRDTAHLKHEAPAIMAHHGLSESIDVKKRWILTYQGEGFSYLNGISFALNCPQIQLLENRSSLKLSCNESCIGLENIMDVSHEKYKLDVAHISRDLSVQSYSLGY